MLWNIKHSLNDMFDGEVQGKYFGGSIEPTLLDAKLAVLERESKERQIKEEDNKKCEQEKKLVIDYWFNQYYLE